MKLELTLVKTESASGALSSVGIACSDSQSSSEVEYELVRGCTSIEEFANDIAGLKDALDKLLKEASSAFAENAAAGPQSPQDIWESLSKATDEQECIGLFNSLDEHTRQEVANYVLTTQNIFKGYASMFSMRFNEQDYTLA